MKPIQNQYQDLLEGKMSKHNFLNNIKSTLSQYVSKGNSYEDAISILKSKRILSEVKPNEIDTVQDKKGNFTKRIKLSDKDKKTVGKVQALMAKEKPLKEMFSSSLKPNSSYEYSGGAETEILKYVGKRQDNPDIKVGSSMGKGHIFQWPDGKYFELGPISVMKYINKIDNEEDEEIINRYDREQEKHALPGGNIYESVEMPANLIADIDKVNPLEYNTGLDYELDLSGDFSAESLVKCAKKVVKNLKKNPIYYTNLKAELTQKINNKKVISSEYTELKKDNQVDKLNQLKSIVKKEIANTKTSLSKQEKASKAMPKGVKLMKESQYTYKMNEIMKPDSKSKLKEIIRKITNEMMGEYSRKIKIGGIVKEEKERAPKLSAKLIQGIIQKSGGPRKDLYYTEDLKDGNVYVISKNQGMYDLVGNARKNIEKYFDIQEESENLEDRYWYEYIIKPNPDKPYPTQPKADIDLNIDDIFENNEKERAPKLSAKLIQGIIQKSGGPRKDLYYTEDLKDGNVYVISKNQGMYDLVGNARKNIEKYFDIQEESENLEDRYWYEYIIKPNPDKPYPTQPKADIDLNIDDIFENNEKERQEKDFSKFSEKMIGKKSTAQNTIKDKIKTYVSNSLKKEAVKFTIGNEKEYVSDMESRGFEDKLKRAGVTKFTKSKV